MKDFYKDYVLEISHSYNKDKNLLLSVTRIHQNNSLQYEEKYTIIDLNTMETIEADLNLIRTTMWKEINWEEICEED